MSQVAKIVLEGFVPVVWAEKKVLRDVADDVKLSWKVPNQAEPKRELIGRCLLSLLVEPFCDDLASA